MKFISKNMAGCSYVLRTKRVSEFKKSLCTSLDFGGTLTETISDVSSDINAIPVVGKGAKMATSLVSAVNHSTKLYIDMTSKAVGCDDIPFEEIKELMNEKFDELERKLDKQVEAMQKVTAMVSKTLDIVEKTRIEMNDGFERVINAITDNAVRQKVTEIYNSVDFFNKETDRINNLGKDDFVSKLTEPNNILLQLKDSRTPKMGNLKSAMDSIIMNKYAIPEDENDSKAFKALFALFYGCQTYVNIFGFLMKSHAYLTNYYYQEGDFEKVNKEIGTLKIVFDDFTASLVRDSSGFIPKVKSVLKDVKKKGFINKVDSKWYNEVTGRSKLIDFLKADIQNMILPIITDIPRQPNLQFKPPNYSTPLGDWESGVKVKYAVQYVENGMYSKLGKWSSTLNVKDKAFPTVKVSAGPQGKLRLIFRQINNDTPQLVGILSKIQTEFRDRDRDLYNAAGETDRELSRELTEKFIEKGSNKDAIFELGRTPLHNAAKAGNVKSYNYLIEKGAKITKDRKGYTPLHVAASEGRSMIINDMLNSNIDPNIGTTEEGYTALQLAVMNNHKNVIDALLKSTKTNVNAKDNNGFTALHAAMNKDPKIVSAVLKGKKEVDINSKTKAGHTAAHIAAMNGEYNVMRVLKDTNKLDINAKDRNNMTPLHYAAMMGNDEMVKKLLNAFGNTDPNVAAKGNNWTPLHYAIYFKKSDSALQLIGRANLNVKYTSDVTLLHMAAATGQDSVVEELLNKKANVNAKTDKGDTPLHLAAINGSKECAELLIQKGGADVKAKNNANRTAFDLAVQYNKEDVLRYLNSVSGKRFIDYEDHFEAKVDNKIISHAVNAAIDVKTPSNVFQLLNQKDVQAANLPIQRVDGNATLLLLDVFLRKFTDKKYNLFLDGSMPEFEAQVKAFDVTQKFEDLLNAVSTLPVSEQIDLSEVASKIKKALMGDRGNDIRKILCSYAKVIDWLKPEDYEKVMQSFQLKAPTVYNAGKGIYAELDSVLKARCT